MASAKDDIETPLDILASTPFFSGVLEAHQLEALCGRLRVADHAKGATLIREDDIGASMFVLASGEVAVTVPGQSGGQHVATLRAPDIFGEMSLMTGARRAATVRTKTSVKAIEIPKAALSPLIIASPELADRFAATLLSRQRELDRLFRGHGRWSVFIGGGDVGSVIRGVFGARR